MKAGNVLVRIAQLKLVKNVVTHAPGGAGGKSGDGTIRKMHSQPAQLPVFRAKFMAPLGDAVGFINGEESDRDPLQPVNGIGPRQPLRRKIEQTIFALGCLAYDLGLLLTGQRTVQHRSRNSHLRQLRRLVLHQRNQRRDDDCGPSQHHGRQLVAQRLSAPGRHDHTTVTTLEQAAHDALLQRPEGIVSPVTPQRAEKVGFRRHVHRRHGNQYRWCGAGEDGQPAGSILNREPLMLVWSRATRPRPAGIR